VTSYLVPQQEPAPAHPALKPPHFAAPPPLMEPELPSSWTQPAPRPVEPELPTSWTQPAPRPMEPEQPTWSQPAASMAPAAPLTWSEPAPQPAPLTNDVIPPIETPDLGPLLAEMPDPETQPTPDLGYPLLLSINQTFDQATLILGGAGTWLRSPGGRAILGISGLFMTAAAVGWLLKDWLGWQ
jgi:hypothetical protein